MPLHPAIASFTTVLWLSVLTTVVTVISFYSVFIVANELEDPFGTEVNDMPMIEYHEEVSAWLLRDEPFGWLAPYLSLRPHKPSRSSHVTASLSLYSPAPHLFHPY